jgi:hypothetical protein
MINDNLSVEAEELDKRIAAIDAEIQKLRASKGPYLEKRRVVLAEIEMQAKLGKLTDVERKRITLNPLPAVGKSSATR